MNAFQLHRFAVAAILPATLCLLLSCQQQKTQQKKPTPQKETKSQKYERVVESFSGPVTDDGGEHADSIKKFFDEFGAALNSGRPGRCSQYFDTRMMLALLKQQKMVPRAISGHEDRLVQYLKQQLPAALADVTWKRCEIRRVQFIKDDDDTEAIVYARHWDADDWPSKTRWWLLRDGDKWRAYDLEFLEISMRFSVVLGMGLKMGDQNDPSVRYLPTLIAVADQGMTGELEPAIRTLQQLDGIGLPPVFESQRLAMLATYLAGTLEYKEAIKTADRVMRINSDLPMIHLVYSECYNGLKQHKKAIEHADLYANLLGKDSDYYVRVGDAYVGMGENDKAIKAYQDGLADNRQCFDSVLALMKIMPIDQRDVVVQHYKALNDVDAWFVGFAEMLLEQGDADTLRTLIDIHKGVMPDDENIPTCEKALAELQRDNSP